jgi:hypothetical protein
MQFSNTTDKNGILQDCEFWTGLGDGGITNKTTLKAQFTSRVNQGFDRLTPFLYSWTTHLKWDDTNATDLPIATFDLATSTADYKIAEDDNSLDILNITAVQVLPSATATQYVDVEVIALDDPRAVGCLSPMTGISGPANYVLVRGNTLHFPQTPGYNATNGCRIFFEREQSYFTASDTTKEPGIPKPFHGLLPLYASYDWLLVNKPANGELITRIEAQIAKREAGLRSAINGRFPSRVIMTPKLKPYL